MLTATTSTTASSFNLASSGSASGGADINSDQDRFLKLLVAQLNNQDPMNPLDNAQMTSQIAQINTVTGIQQVNSTLKNMAEQFTALQVLQGANMVGHEVLVQGNTLSIQNGSAGAAIDLTARAESVKIEVLSPGGQVIDTFQLGALDAGRHSFDWDASSYQGTGNPSFKVTATLGGKAVETSSMTRAKVTSVSSTAGVMQVQLQGLPDVAYSNIKAIL